MSAAFQPNQSVSARYGRRKRSVLPKVMLLALLVAGAGGAAWWFLLHRAVALAPLPAQRVVELRALKLQIVPVLKNIPPDELLFVLDNPPEGATLDPATGIFAWTPNEAQGPGEFDIGVRVGVKGNDQLVVVQPLRVTVDEENQPPIVEAIPDQILKDGATTLTIRVVARDSDLPAQELSYGLLAGAPKGISIDRHTGVVTWSPKSVEHGTPHPVSVQVADAAKKTAVVKFNLIWHREARPLEKLLAGFENNRMGYKMTGREPMPLFPGQSKIYEIGGDRLSTYEWDTEQTAFEALQAAGDKIPPALRGSIYTLERLIVVYQGSNDAVRQQLQDQLGSPRTLAVSNTPVPTPMPTPAPMPTTPDKPAPSPFVVKVRELHEGKRLLLPKEYPTIRKLYAEDFYARHSEIIKLALGADHDDMLAWFDKHTDVKEDFYTAIDPQHDKVPECFQIFNTLRKQFPKPLEVYGQLAIAMSVVWDDPQGLYQYDRHATRTHATMPTTLAEMADNFKYLVDAEPIMQGRIRYMPWEFLTLIVNHPTPLAERSWALEKYLARRSMFGACYAEVPYDYEMLRSDDQVCRLANKEYTLANLLQFGGVCAQQADFASRVGKSLGVPSMYVTGEANNGGLHAWVMWIELKQVTATNIVFSLESHGRYFGDNYYVGKLNDPQTGQRTTDRALELAMQNVGVNPLGRRHAALVMRTYPELRRAAELPVDKQLQFLSDVLKFSPGNEAAWQGIAAIAKSEKLGPPQQKQMVAALDNLFRTFSKFPDFTWKVFDDLIQFQPDVKQHITSYERLTQLYLQASRPDLACEAGLKWADLLVADGRQLLAVEGLAGAVLKFPEEGRYVPKMLDRIESAAGAITGGDTALVNFYQAFLPKVPKTRSGTPTDHCKAMYTRGIAMFRRLNRPDLAQQYEQELAKLNTKPA